MPQPGPSQSASTGRPASDAAEFLTVTPRAQAAATFVAALGKAARAFVLYDPANAVVRQFLEDYRAKATKALEGGPLALEIRPEEIAVGEEIVYRDADREKSLAYRLFRDGVRRLTLAPAIGWDELLRFLEILAIRFTGIRQQEEDVVTLLRRAAFHAIALEAVEGFAPEEQDEGEGAAEAPHVAPPPGWDEPLPRLPAPVALARRAVPDELVADLRADLAPEALVPAALAAVRDALAEAARAGWPNPDADLDAFLAEIGKFLVAEGDLKAALQLADMLGRQGRSAAAAALLQDLSDPTAVAAFLARLPEDARVPPPELAGLVAAIPLAPVIELLAAEQRPARRALLLALVSARLPGDGAALAERLPSVEPDLGLELLKLIAERAPDHAAPAAAPLLASADRRLQSAALSALEAAQAEAPTAPLVALLASQDEALRVRVLLLLGRRGAPEAFAALERWAEGRKDLSRSEADALGRALAQVAPIPAFRLFARWLEPEKKGLGSLLRSSSRKEAFTWAAACGLAVIAIPEAEQWLTALAQRGDADLKRHCLAALAARRRGGHARG